ncbi:uncharacterized protein LOC124699114 [Lolium rigidum]|uniref:uncharacterized protein LOC124699114 n=1 Tax=Lolium rigidum TaxID=89674 RepID=UPI001F5D9AF1|nr:uncharacterized protein LOC124699114 [Lolium rigidum]
MDGKAHDVEVLTRRVEELQRERDELRKDIEQLCMQQSGPGYVSVATRMLSQRATALEQDIESLQKKLSGCLRENHNLQEELAEAYRVKSQLADLYGAELSKTKELEQQVRFFQSSVAKAFAERDNSLLEEREEAGLKMSAVFEERTKEYQSAMEDQKRLNDVLQMELTELKANTESSLNVILKFYEVRCRECECPSNVSFEEKCSILLDDSAENWSFSSDGETSTSKYIASLEEENESLKAKIVKLQSNLRMGFEIEQHLQRNARALEKKQALNDDLMRNGLSALKNVYTNQRVEIMKILEEESLQLNTVVNQIQDKLTQIRIHAENIGNPVGEMQCCDSSCKDVHVTTDISPDNSPKDDVPAGRSATFDDSKWLAQALQEKMEALMLFSQEQERYLLENQKNQATIEDLQKNLSQVKDEKVKALMELAKLKEAYLLKCKSTAIGGHGTVDTPKITSGHDQQGMLKTILNRTSLRQWIKKENSNTGHGSSDGNDRTVYKECSVDLARIKVENATLLESIATMERLTSLVHRLHNVLMKVYDDIKSDSCLESTYEALNSLITEANLMKTALGVVLPVSWSGDSSGAITSDNLHDSSDSPKSSKSEKADPLSSASMEMVELLILAADIVKESFMLKR